MSDDGIRPPKVGLILVLVLLLGSVGATAWWLNRPKPDADPVGPPPVSDVFCPGRVDTARPVVALDPAQAGRIVEVLVVEGDEVKAGQPILKLDESTAEARLSQALAALEGAQIELDFALRDKDRFPKQLEARGFLVKAATARVEAAKKALQQRKESQSVSPLGEAELGALEAQIRELENFELAERGQLDDLKKIDPELRIRGARAKLKAAGADRDLAVKAKAECVVVAPGPGTILRVQASVGGLIAPGTYAPAVVFAPAGAYVIRAEVDQEALGRVTEGMAAEAHDENRPDGPVWKGKVLRVSRWVAQRRAYVLEPGEINDVRTVECVIALDASSDRLWIGQRMRVRMIRGDK